MRKTDLTDVRPLETLTFEDIKRILAHSIATLEAENEPGTVAQVDLYFEMISTAYNAGYNVGRRNARKELKV